MNSNRTRIFFMALVAITLSAWQSWSTYYLLDISNLPCEILVQLEHTITSSLKTWNLLDQNCLKISIQLHILAEIQAVINHDPIKGLTLFIRGRHVVDNLCRADNRPINFAKLSVWWLPRPKRKYSCNSNFRMGLKTN